MLPALLLAAAVAAPPKPLRHLEFSFHFSGSQESISHYSGIETTLPGVGTAFSFSGYDGIIYVDVIGVGPNDTLMVSIRQGVPLAHSLDSPSAQILTHPTGEVDIAPGSAPLRQPELNLARFLGRKFINGDYLDEKNHWRITFPLSQNTTAATDFTITKNTDGILDIDEAQRVASGMDIMRTAGHITYDMNRTVPLSIHEESAGTGTNSGIRFTYDYKLTADSLAPAKP